MPYYPTFALFDHPVSLKSLASPVWEQFGEALPDIGFSLDSASETAPLTFTSGSEALIGLKSTSEGLKRFWMANPYHRLSFSQRGGQAVEIELWDFNADDYEHGKVTRELAEEKRRLAFSLHRLLLSRAQASITFTGNYDQKYAGEPNLDDMADTFESLLEQPMPLVDHFTSVNPVLFWLIGYQRPLESAQLKLWLPVLHEEFLVAEETPGFRLLEYADAIFRPHFLRVVG